MLIFNISKVQVQYEVKIFDDVMSQEYQKIKISKQVDLVLLKNVVLILIQLIHHYNN